MNARASHSPVASTSAAFSALPGTCLASQFTVSRFLSTRVASDRSLSWAHRVDQGWWLSSAPLNYQLLQRATVPSHWEEAEALGSALA